jgi:hypothetical protein
MDAAPLPTFVAHDTEWFSDDIATQYPINGITQPRQWGLKTPIGDILTSGCDVRRTLSRLDYYLLMFPPNALTTICNCTNLNLDKLQKPTTTKGELLKFFGVMILITRFEFTNQSSLWSSKSSKYIPAVELGKTGMSHQRFDDLWKCIQFSSQPETRPNKTCSEQYRWMLIDDFIAHFNEHHINTFIPSSTICVDESMFWYGQGGKWINMGLPMYVSMDRKPDSGCEIQNSACGESGVMLHLKIAKTAEEEDHHSRMDDTGLLHGTSVLKYLVEPWAFSEQIVCADSYFASVGAALELQRIGLCFIGVVKTATHQFPMHYLSRVELQQRGDRYGLVTQSNNGGPRLLAFVWMDPDRRYFIASASSLEPGMPYVRQRWRQVDNAPNAEPTRVFLTVSQPKAAEIYYSCNGKIDQHNCHWADTLSLE